MSRYNTILNNMKNFLLSHSSKILKGSCDIDDSPAECKKEKLENQLEIEILKRKLNQLKSSAEEDENETPETELMEYKADFLNMNIGSLRAIMNHAASILKSVEENNEMVKNNLTESWLQGKIAITEDYMRTIHDFVKYVSESADKTTAGCGCGGNKKKTDAKPVVNPNTKLTVKPEAQTQGQSPQPHTHEAKPKN